MTTPGASASTSWTDTYLGNVKADHGPNSMSTESDSDHPPTDPVLLGTGAAVQTKSEEPIGWGWQLIAWASKS